MKLITSEIDRKLRFYYRQNLSEDGLPLERGRLDPYPPLKLFTPWGKATWLISERDDEEPDQLFGLADLGFGCPELGWISLAELEALQGPWGLKVERDRHFTPTMTISEYAEKARAAGRIDA